VAKAQLNAEIRGGVLRRVARGSLMWIDASSSGDPDAAAVNRTADPPLRYEWSCRIDGGRCRSAGGAVVMFPSVPVFELNLSAIDVPSFVSRIDMLLTLRQPGAAGTLDRTAMTSLEIHLIDEPTFELSISTVKRLKTGEVWFESSADPAGSGINVTWEWSISGASLRENGTALLENPLFSPIGAANRRLVLFLRSVPGVTALAPGSYALTLSAAALGREGRAMVMFDVAAAPSGGTCVLDSSSGVALRDVTLRCSAWFRPDLPARARAPDLAWLCAVGIRHRGCTQSRAPAALLVGAL